MYINNISIKGKTTMFMSYSKDENFDRDSLIIVINRKIVYNDG